MDDIGIGRAIANMTYIALLAILFSGCAVFLVKRKIVASLFWFSIILNLLTSLYFIGNYIFYPFYIRPLVTRVWPMIDIALFVVIVVYFFRNKNAQKK